jgi:hypothetical protein
VTAARKPKAKPATSRSLEELEALAKKMRELGVTEFDGVTLGPAPPPPPKELSAKEHTQKALDAENRQRDIMFAASSVKPRLRKAVV